MPFHLTTALAAGSSAGSSSFWCLEETLGKEAKLPFWRSLWEPLQVGCSCWHSRESGKIVVNPPGQGGCFMPSPTGCWWGQPRAGRDTCSTGIVPFFGLATEGGKGGRAIEVRKETRGAAWEAFMEHGCGSAFLKPKISPLVCVLLCS